MVWGVAVRFRFPVINCNFSKCYKASVDLEGSHDLYHLLKAGVILIVNTVVGPVRWLKEQDFPIFTKHTEVHNHSF
jgi:hypothetical protein